MQSLLCNYLINTISDSLLVWLNVTTYLLLPLIVLSKNVISCKSCKPLSAHSLGNTDISQRSNTERVTSVSKTSPDTHRAQRLTTEQGLHQKKMLGLCEGKLFTLFNYPETVWELLYLSYGAGGLEITGNDHG